MQRVAQRCLIAVHLDRVVARETRGRQPGVDAVGGWYEHPKRVTDGIATSYSEMSNPNWRTSFADVRGVNRTLRHNGTATAWRA